MAAKAKHTNEIANPKKSTKTVKVPDKNETADVARVSGEVVINTYRDTLLHEEEADKRISAHEEKALNAILADMKNASEEERKQIRNECFRRIDKECEKQQWKVHENTKRLKWIVISASSTVLGVAFLKYLPSILESIRKNTKL